MFFKLDCHQETFFLIVVSRIFYQCFEGPVLAFSAHFLQISEWLEVAAVIPVNSLPWPLCVTALYRHSSEIGFVRAYRTVHAGTDWVLSSLPGVHKGH
jgi:hypothetical protein